ncbi:MAG TPA: hypothetical protein VFA95_15375 [Gammaproteobacteria bacterium]|nr:hypothetical protein [Gammaproteobacteria bacterium]
MQRNTLARLRLLALRDDRRASAEVRTQQQVLRELEEQERLIAEYRDSIARTWTDAPAWMAAYAAAFARAADHACDMARAEQQRQGRILEQHLEQWHTVRTRRRRIEETDARARQQQERSHEKDQEKERQGQWRPGRDGSG